MVNGIPCDIYLSERNGKCAEYGFRRCVQVPRIGERIELRRPKVDDKYHLADVIMVHWGEDTVTFEQRAAIIVKWHRPAKLTA